MNAEQLLTAALAHVESDSIRRWATNERNRSIWIQIAGRAIASKRPEPTRLAAFIVATAIGL